MRTYTDNDVVMRKVDRGMGQLLSGEFILPAAQC